MAFVARHGLPHEAQDDAVIGPMDDDRFAGLTWHCEHHRLLGLLGAAVRDESVLVTPGQRDQLEIQLQAWLGHALRVERMLLEATDALDVAGVDHRVLKGVALAHLAYPDPAWRVFGDLDLLVPGDRLSTAVGVLERTLGVERAEAELRPGFDDRFGKEALLQAPGGPELDLHRTFAEGALGLTIQLDDLFGSGQPVTVGGHRLLALPPSQQLIHATYAAVMGDWPPRFASIRDVAQIILTLDPPFDEVLGFARRWRAETVLAQGITMAWDLLTPRSESALASWAAAYRPRRFERLLLASQIGPTRGTTRHLAALLVVPGLIDRAAYLRAVAWPQPAYLRSRGLDRRRHLFRAVDRLSRRSAPPDAR
jgi:hypothetical protein